jgi:hypothetical protein
MNKDREYEQLTPQQKFKVLSEVSAFLQIRTKQDLNQSPKKKDK